MSSQQEPSTDKKRIIPYCIQQNRDHSPAFGGADRHDGRDSVLSA